MRKFVAALIVIGALVASGLPAALAQTLAAPAGPTNPTFEVRFYEENGFTCKIQGSPAIADKREHQDSIDRRINSFRLRPRFIPDLAPRVIPPVPQTLERCGASLKDPAVAATG